MEDKEIIIKTLEKEKELLQEQLRKRSEHNNDKEIELNKLKVENKELRKQLDSILYSRSYRFLQKIVKIIKR